MSDMARDSDSDDESVDSSIVRTKRAAAQNEEKGNECLRSLSLSLSPHCATHPLTHPCSPHDQMEEAVKAAVMQAVKTASSWKRSA